MKNIYKLFLLTLLFLNLLSCNTAESPSKKNIVVLKSDDASYTEERIVLISTDTIFINHKYQKH